MDVTEIQDWQFGQLRSDARWGWCASGVEWTTGLPPLLNHIRQQARPDDPAFAGLQDQRVRPVR